MSSNPIDVNYRTLLSNLIEVSKPSIIYLLDFVAISALLIAYYDPNYVTNPISFTIVISLLIAGTLSSAGSAALNCYIDRDIDIKMARMDGEELLKRLRKKTVIPILFLTSKDEEVDELLGLKLGADDFI